MTDSINRLQDFVRLLMGEKRLTYRDVAAHSAKQISHSTVSDIVNGRNTNPSPKILRGLAKGLGTTEEEIFALVRGILPNEDVAANEGLFRNLQRLSPEKRLLAKKQIAAIIDSLADSEPNFNYIDDEKK